MWDRKSSEHKRENRQQLLWLGHSSFLSDMSLVARETKTKMNYWDLIKVISFCIEKETIKTTKRQLMEWEKIFANDISNKGLVSKIPKVLIKQHPKTQIIQLKNEQNTWTDISPKKTYRWPTDTWKDVQHHSSPGKCKSKLQWDTTSHLSEWLK